MKKSMTIAIFLAFILFIVALASVPATIEDFFLPGSQIGQSGNIETPDRCDNCHGGYDQAVEPAFNWRGSMMSQAARDPLFYACLAIANQDVPDVGDLCLRCHTPDGWLNGRCIPTDGSALNNNDRQGVQCDFCHKMVKPTPPGVNPFPNDAGYTSTAYGSGTYTQDQQYLGIIIPIPGTSANGMYIADANNAKRGPFTDATGRHQMFYSPFHSQSEHCGTCHDVSNPAFTRANITVTDYTFNTPDLPSETFDLRLMFPVERTFSEWQASGYNSPGTVDHVTCQDCHMRDVTGKGAKMKDAPNRTNLPLHDMTGGNTFIPNLVKQLYPAEVNAAALDAGIDRARTNLGNSADMTLDVSNNTATVTIVNNTGHKLPTGYPEGRRMWINLKAFNGNTQVYESGAYNFETAELVDYDETKIYECKPGMSLDVATAAGFPPEAAGPSFHFALNNMIYKDNRIPPAGFTNDGLIAAQSPVVGYSYPDGQNYDITVYTIPDNITFDKVEARLYYQTTTKEYVEFLRDENNTNSKGQELYDLWVAHGKSAPELMEFVIWGDVANPQLEAEILDVYRVTNKQNMVSGVADVYVYADGSPVPGVTVVTSYTGPTTGTATGVTDNSGRVLLESNKKKNPVGEWCFTITSASKDGFVSGPTVNTTTFMCEGDLKTSPADMENTRNEDGIAIYPNPVREITNITYSLSETSLVNIMVYDQSGRNYTTLVNTQCKAGKHSMTWNTATLPEGIYLMVMQTGSTRLVKRFVVIR